MFKNIVHPNNEPMSLFKAYFKKTATTKRIADRNRGKNLYLYTTLKLILLAFIQDFKFLNFGWFGSQIKSDMLK
ncbi:hypothetical protein IO90_09665 [Chryseobacterium sp. FH1]|nr:hypothetical protein IO90_09665 [Chryseobacterium sp. FH1]